MILASGMIIKETTSYYTKITNIYINSNVSWDTRHDRHEIDMITNLIKKTPDNMFSVVCLPGAVGRVGAYPLFTAISTNDKYIFVLRS